MALAFFTRKKRQKYLNWILVIAFLIAALWFGQNYLVKPSSPPPTPSKKKTVEINLKVLENPALQELQLFEEITPFEGEVGRENPFLPY